MESSQQGTTVSTYSRFIRMILNELGQALHYLVIGIVLLLIIFLTREVLMFFAYSSLISEHAMLYMIIKEVYTSVMDRVPWPPSLLK